MSEAFKAYGLCLLFGAAPAHADSTTITFDGLTDSSPVIAQYSANGVNFANAVALTAGISLNEFDFPPYSGATVLADDLAAPLLVSFSMPMFAVSAWFTYATPLQIHVFDFSGNVLGDVVSPNPSNLGTSTLIQIPFLNVGRLDFSSTQTGSFTVDNLSFTSAVPEAPEWLLLGAGLFVTAAHARRRRGVTHR